MPKVNLDCSRYIQVPLIVIQAVANANNTMISPFVWYAAPLPACIDNIHWVGLTTVRHPSRPILTRNHGLGDVLWNWQVGRDRAVGAVCGVLIHLVAAVVEQ